MVEGRSVSTVGARGASGGSLGSTRGVGVSLSPEARGGMRSSKSQGKSSFETRTNSIFNTNVLSPQKNSIISIDRMKSVNSRPSLFNINNPIARRETPIRTSPETKARVGAIRTKEPGIISLDKGRKAQAPIIRVDVLRPKTTSIIDINRPIARPTGKSEIRTVRSTFRKEVSFVKPLFSPEKTQNTVRQEQSVQIREQSKDSKKTEGEKNKTSLIKERQPMKIAEGKRLSQVKLSDLLVVSPFATPQEVQKIRYDIKDAKKTVYTKVQAQSISYKTALSEISQFIAKKYDKVVFVKPIPAEKPALRTEEAPETDTKSETEVKTVVQTDATVSPQEEELKQQAIPGEVKNKYDNEKNKKEKNVRFARDARAEKQRLHKLLEVFAKVLRMKKDAPVTGQDIAYELNKMGHEDGVRSELVLEREKDGSYSKFIGEVANLGEMVDEERVRFHGTLLIEKVPAVLLTGVEGGEAASEQDAVRVLGAPLEKQDVTFMEQEERNGIISRDTDGQLWFQSKGVRKRSQKIFAPVSPHAIPIL